MDSTSPVLTHAEVESEQVIALYQKPYYPIIVARVIHADGSKATYTRFCLSSKERELVAKGADIILGQPHHFSLMPISIDVALPDQYPEGWK